MNILSQSGEFISKIIVIFDIVETNILYKNEMITKGKQEKLKTTYLKQKTSL